LDEKVWNIHLEKSDKKAKTFKKINIACDTFGVIQPSILQYSGNKLQLLCRSRQNAVVQTWSNDNGNTWSPLMLTNLPNPNSGTDATTLKMVYKYWFIIHLKKEQIGLMVVTN